MTHLDAETIMSLVGTYERLSSHHEALAVEGKYISQEMRNRENDAYRKLREYVYSCVCLSAVTEE